MPDGWFHIRNYWQAGGALVLPITAVCFALWFMVCRMHAGLKAGLADLNRVMTGLPARVSGASHTERTSAHATHPKHGIEAALDHVLNDLERGIPFPAAFEEHVAPGAVEAGRDLAIVRALIVAAPLLGLLGTVLGMMETFGAADGRDMTESVAAGIGTALITTQFGLFVALPGMFGASRIARLLRHYQARLTVFRTRMIIELDRHSRRSAA